MTLLVTKLFYTTLLFYDKGTNMSQSKRILKILQMLFDNQSINSDRLSDYFETDKRSIQRDIKLLKEFFGDRLYQPSRGEYILQDSENLYSFIQNEQNSNNLKAFFEFITLFDDKLLSFFDQDEFPMIKQIRRESKIYYHIHEKPIEILNSSFLDDIKEAISQRRYVNLTFCEIKPRDLEMVKPLKIVFAEGNWYLAVVTKNYKFNYGFKFFRINFVTHLKLLPQTFQREIEAEKFIEDFQSLFQNYKDRNYEVTLRIDAMIARYFRVKKHLKSQRIIETKENGDMIMTYQINNDMELLPLIKKWLPYIKVLSPKSLDDRIKKDVAHYLKT